MEKTIKSRIAYRGPFFLIREHEIEFPDGEKGKRMVLEHPGAVAAVPITVDGGILLVKQYRKAVEKETLEIPAGKIEPGETLRDCVNRELMEETGYRAGKLTFLISYYPSCGISSEIIHIFLAEDLREATGRNPDEHFLGRTILPLEKAQRMIREGDIRDSKTIIALRELEHRGRI